MNKKSIAIITGVGGHLGTGHFQRMCSLAVFLNRSGIYSANIFIAAGEPDVPRGIEDLMVKKLPGHASLIIRDMRDSSEEEIASLRKTAPVLVIDDTGGGRSIADHVLDLLPSPVSAESFNGIFIYGYNFIKSINAMNLYDFIKDIDVAIYAGYDPDMNYINSLLKSIPENTTAVLFRKGKPEIMAGNSLTVAGYADTLLRSRILITHFGISMYEGDLAGCRIVLVNPSSYHTELAHFVLGKMDVTPAGEYDNINHDLIRSVISGTSKEAVLRIISSRSIRERINIGLEYFTRYLNKIFEAKQSD